jgi:hypothetical protein
MSSFQPTDPSAVIADRNSAIPINPNAVGSNTNDGGGDWEDAVLNVDRAAYVSGYEEGVRDTVSSHVAFADGYETGFSKGYSLAAEVAFVEMIVKLYLEKLNQQPQIDTQADTNTEWSSSSSNAAVQPATQTATATASISERTRKRLINLLELTTTYTSHISARSNNHTNSSEEEDFDYGAKLEEIRSIFRSLNINGITGMRRNNGDEEPVSNEW